MQAACPEDAQAAGPGVFPAMKKPRHLGFRGSAGAKAAAGRRGRLFYMLSIITWPKPEQLTWVAPSMRRAKS